MMCCCQATNKSWHVHQPHVHPRPSFSARALFFSIPHHKLCTNCNEMLASRHQNCRSSSATDENGQVARLRRLLKVSGFWADRFGSTSWFLVEANWKLWKVWNIQRWSVWCIWNQFNIGCKTRHNSPRFSMWLLLFVWGYAIQQTCWAQGHNSKTSVWAADFPSQQVDIEPNEALTGTAV